jgi:hypothetical protein
MVWTVTTDSEMPDERERRRHDTAAEARHDYDGRILEFEIHGYVCTGESVIYGREWRSQLVRGDEVVTVKMQSVG